MQAKIARKTSGRLCPPTTWQLLMPPHLGTMPFAQLHKQDGMGGDPRLLLQAPSNAGSRTFIIVVFITSIIVIVIISKGMRACMACQHSMPLGDRLKAETEQAEHVQWQQQSQQR